MDEWSEVKVAHFLKFEEEERNFNFEGFEQMCLSREYQSNRCVVLRPQ